MKTIAPDPAPIIDLLRRILEGIVAHKEDLVIEHRKTLTSSMTITIQAHLADTARLIGEGALTYRALSALARAIGAQRGLRINIPPIREPVTGEPERYKFAANPDWPKAEIDKLLDDTCRAAFCHPEIIGIAYDHDDENITSTAEVTVSRSEPAEVVAAMSASLSRVFDAIGRNHGRLFVVDVIPNGDAVEKQPATAQGRYSR